MSGSPELDAIAADGVEQLKHEIAEALPLLRELHERVRRMDAIQRETARRLGGRRLGSYLNVIGYCAVAGMFRRALNEPFMTNFQRLIADVERREQASDAQ